MSEELRPYKIDPNPVPLTDGQRAILDAIPMREPGPIGGCRAQPAAPSITGIGTDKPCDVFPTSYSPEVAAHADGFLAAKPASPADAAPSVAPEPVAWRWSESNGERWFDWTADWTHHDRAKSLGYRVEYAHPPRAPLTEEFWLMLDTALDALKYHQEQTRPIELTRVTIAAVETFISAHGIGGK